MDASSLTGTPMARAGASSFSMMLIMASALLEPLAPVKPLEEDLPDHQPGQDSDGGGNEPGDHERVVQDVFADPRRPAAVKVDGGDQRAVGRDEEVAVDGRE